MTDKNDAVCPTHGTSLFEDKCEYFCQECSSFYCPYCFASYNPFTLDTPDLCTHYLCEEMGEYGAIFDLKQPGEELELSIPKAHDLLLYLLEEKSELNADSSFGLSGAEINQAKEILSSLADTELLTHFGSLYKCLAESYTVDIAYACVELQIGTIRGYLDEQNWVTVHYVAAGRDHAWKILRPALQQYVDGVNWLVGQVRR